MIFPAGVGLRSSFRLLGVCAALACAADAHAQASPGDRPSVPEERLERLRRGINLNHWFTQDWTDRRRFIETAISADDLARIKGWGFTHVRLPVDPEWLADSSGLNAELIALLDAKLDLIEASGLAAIVEMHPTPEFKEELSRSEARAGGFASLWHSLALHLGKRDPRALFLEIMNEPAMRDAERWAAIQRSVLRSIRKATPAHTVVLTSHMWSGVDDLVATTPVRDPNTVYTLHFYESNLFTMQGSHWAGWDVLEALAGVPYPSSPEAVRPLLRGLPAPAQAELRRYGEERWDARRIAARLAKVSAWARKHGVAWFVGEFGVRKTVAPPAAASAWIRDVRAALERLGVGWTYWAYLDEDGMMDGPPDAPASRTINPAIARGLGLPGF